jgi:hypothetical protein
VTFERMKAGKNDGGVPSPPVEEARRWWRAALTDAQRKTPSAQICRRTIPTVRENDRYPASSARQSLAGNGM